MERIKTSEELHDEQPEVVLTYNSEYELQFAKNMYGINEHGVGIECDSDESGLEKGCEVALKALLEGKSVMMSAPTEKEVFFFNPENNSAHRVYTEATEGPADDEWTFTEVVHDTFGGWPDQVKKLCHDFLDQKDI